MSSTSTPVNVEPEKKASSEIVFKYINLMLLAMLVYCVRGFLAFHDTIIEKGYRFVSPDAWWWALFGFVAFGIIKYSYLSFVRPRLAPHIDNRYQGEERLYRQRQVSKLTFDTIFYSISSFVGFYLFSNESWFPDMAGGKGQCENIYGDFPNWPRTEVSDKIQIFYMLQLGKCTFGIFESLFIKGPSDRKFYEFLLHHFIATTLIILSLLSNEVTVGTVILVIHDFSDITAAFCRAIVETKYRNMWIDAVLFFITLANWFYMRSVAFPLCIIKQIFQAIPTPQDTWWPIRVEHTYLLLLCCVLACMHLFWCFFLVQYGYFAAFKKKIMNPHDKVKQ